MIVKIDAVVREKLAKHVREKLVERLGKLHYAMEQLVKGLEKQVQNRLEGYDEVLAVIRRCRTTLRGEGVQGQKQIAK